MGKLKCGIVTDIILGMFLIGWGLCRVYFWEGDVVTSYVFCGAGIALLVWIGIKISLDIGMKCSLCPKCGFDFNLKELVAFTTNWGMRLGDPCPECSTMLIRTKWPARVVYVALPILVVCALWPDFAPEDQWPKTRWAVFIAALLLIEAAAITSRFEIVGEPKENTG